MPDIDDAMICADAKRSFSNINSFTIFDGKRASCQYIFYVIIIFV